MQRVTTKVPENAAGTIETEEEIKKPETQESSASVKYGALLILIIQNSGHALILRYSRIYRPSSEIYIATTAVICSELLKVFASLLIFYFYECERDFLILRNIMCSGEMGIGGDMARLIIPSALYVIQNNLQYIAMSNLRAEVFQVLSQMKIITTALLSVIMLEKKLVG